LLHWKKKTCFGIGPASAALIFWAGNKTGAYSSSTYTVGFLSDFPNPLPPLLWQDNFGGFFFNLERA